MIDGWKTYTQKPIEFKSDLDTTVAIFYLETSSGQVSEQVSEQASDQVVLDFCKEEKSIQEIMDFLKMSHRTYFRKTILKPLLEKGLLELTIPDKPTSPKQKYITKEMS